MSENPDLTSNLTRAEASEAVGVLGWGFLLGAVQTAVPVASIDEGVRVVAVALTAAGSVSSGSLSVDLRPDRVTLTLKSPSTSGTTRQEADCAERVSAAIEQLGRSTVPATEEPPRSLQVLELAIDALDIPAIRPFWKAVMAYAGEPGRDGPTAPLVDPLGQGPAIWFQQMDRPRPQRNRIHFDLCLPHDEARPRLAAALAAGGVLVSQDRAPAFWVLADREQNEVCITTWQGRD
jgi:4a-hydroxytetrahydrobiopterin dehydratase